MEDLLLLETSRRNTDMLAEMIFQKEELFDELFRIYLRNEEPVSRRAAWVIDAVTEKLPALLTDKIDIMAEAPPSFNHNGLKRHTLHILSRSPLPAQKHSGFLINLCFGWLVSPVEAVATKIYCMELLYRFSEGEPDIKQELVNSIEWRLYEEPPGFRSRGVKVLKKLYKDLSFRK
jgi:hypothetical protein